MTEIHVGKVTFNLREPYDFSWLLELGEPFAVFDQNDSGNISFGVERAGRRFFVKFAGARPAAYPGGPADAVARLRAAAEVYREIFHPALIRLVSPLDLPGGFALIFDWAEGECLHDHWNFDRRPKLTDPASPYRRFRALPAEKKLAAAETLFDFLCRAERAGFTAVDFYDASLLYDFDSDTLTLCDVDLFRRSPAVNGLGEDWPCSPRLAAPEDRVLGAPIDGVTDVFHLGKLLLILLAGEDHPDRAHWEGSEGQWRAVQRAIRPEREARFQSVKAFCEEWENPLESSWKIW